MRRGAGSALALKAQSCWACHHRGTRGPWAAQPRTSQCAPSHLSPPQPRLHLQACNNSERSSLCSVPPGHWD